MLGRSATHRARRDRRIHAPNPAARLHAAIEPLERRALLTAVVVNSVSDTDTAGTVTLRDAVATANDSATPTTITFDPAVFATPQTITLTQGARLEFGGSTTITGPAAGLTVSGDDLTRVFFIDDGASVSISKVTVTDGHGNDNNGDGGAIYVAAGGDLALTDATLSGCTGVAGSHGGGLANYGTATLDNDTISDNVVVQTADGNNTGQGGGIYNQGTLSMSGGTVSGNTADQGGGGIFNAGTLTLDGTSILSNTAAAAGDGYGGGLQNQGEVTGDAEATVTDVTVAGNTVASDSGGGIASDLAGADSGGTTSITLTNVTVTDNSAPAGTGGGIWLDANNEGTTLAGLTVSGNSAGNEGGGVDDEAGSGATMANTIVDGNTLTTAGATGPDVSGAVDSAGHNLVGETDGSSGWVGSDLTGTSAAPLEADLGPLADNGGPTETLLPRAGSPAIGAGSVALIPTGVDTDQRGDPRTLNGAVDIGAVEVGGTTSTPTLAASVTTFTASAHTLVVGQSDTFTIVVAPAGGSGPTPTGTVSISEDGDAKGTFALVNGALSESFTADTAGANTVYTAVYNGDGNYASGTSNGVAQTYLPASTAAAKATRTVAPTAGIAGQKFAAHLPVFVTNGGATLAGAFTLTLYLDAATVGLDGSPVVFATLALQKSLRTGKSFSATLNGKLLPASLTPGIYSFVIELTDPTGAASLVTTSRTVAVAAAVVTPAIAGVVFKPDDFGIKPQTFTFTVTVSNTGNIAGTGTITITDEAYDEQLPLGSAAPATDSFKANIKPGKSQRFVIHRRYGGTGTLSTGTFNTSVVVTLDGATASALFPDTYTVA